ncbi:MAG: hypothetical protein HFF72_13265 [Oscillospiraceae bacterium]|nr:hypothetical protein [Oscillospiraceae bacterium]
MLEWIISSSLLILIVLFLRAVLGKRISAGLQYGLWSVVLARLLVPVTLFSLAIMALPAAEPPEALRQESIYVLPVESRPAEESGVRFAEDGRIEAPDSFGYARLEDEGRTIIRYTEKVSLMELLGWIWAAGAAVMAVVLIIANVRFTIRLRRVRRPLEGTSAPVPVYTAMGLPSPCLVGHEGALKRLGGGERTAYGETLLALVTAKSKPADLLSFATTMTGGKRSLKERIRRIAVQPRRLASAVVAVVVILSLAAVCAFGRAEAKEADPLFQPPGLCWNDSMATVIEKLGITEEQILYNEQDELSDPNTAKEQSLAVKDVSFLGYNTTVGFNFIHYVGAADGYGLNNVTVAFPEEADMAAVKAELIERYGEGEAGKSDPNYAYLALWPDLPDPQPDKENHHMYWTADRAALPEGYEDRVRDWLLNVRYKSAAPEKIEEYLAEAPMATLHWTDDWLLLTDILTANRVSFDAKQLVEFLQNVPLDETEPFSTYVRPYDVNRDGVQEGTAFYNSGRSSERVELTQGSTEDRTVIWSKTLDESAGSWDMYFCCRIDGLDYLLEYSPKIEDGFCDYSYRFFHLEDGEEVTDRKDQITFDIRFDSPDHRFDPSEIAAFMCEINEYIAAGKVILGGGLDSLNLEREEYTERLLRDNILVTLGASNTEYTTEEELRDALTDFAAYAQDHPDDTWSPLADLLMELTMEDIAGLHMNTDELEQLVRYLKEAERGSRFYTWSSFEDACGGHNVWEHPGALLEVPLADESTLYLFASAENDNVLIMLENSDDTVTAFYDAPDLKQFVYKTPTAEMPVEIESL